MDTLTRFNQQILQCQDDAYTLAWYLLGDEVAADAVMQKAVAAAFDCFVSGDEDCRLTVLQRVVEQFLRRKPAACSSAEPGIFHDLCFLADQERVVLLLIDVFGLSYPEAARIIGQTSTIIGRLLAHARWKMKDHQKFTDG